MEEVNLYWAQLKTPITDDMYKFGPNLCDAVSSIWKAHGEGKGFLATPL